MRSCLAKTDVRPWSPPCPPKTTWTLPACEGAGGPRPPRNMPPATLPDGKAEPVAPSAAPQAPQTEPAWGPRRRPHRGPRSGPAVRDATAATKSVGTRTSLPTSRPTPRRTRSRTTPQAPTCRCQTDTRRLQTDATDRVVDPVNCSSFSARPTNYQNKGFHRKPAQMRCPP